MRRLAAVLAALASVVLAPDGGPAAASAHDAPTGYWVAGDLHVHTTYSHDSYGGPDDDNTGPNEFFTLGHSVESQFALAASRGLTFLAITDHNDVRAQSDLRFATHGVIGVPAYENSLNGHAQMLGATELFNNGDAGAAAVQSLASQLRLEGGAFQINHPGGDTIDPDQPDWGYGYAVAPDSVEVWNISPLWQPPMPSGNSIDVAISYWEGWLDRGVHVGATGGSDNHWLSTTAVQGVGQPTTWVYVTESTTAAIIEGIRMGRTTISAEPPAAGTRAFVEADADGDGDFEALMGETVPATAAFRVRVAKGAGATLTIYGSGGNALGLPVPVTGTHFVHKFTPPADTTWVRAEVGVPDAADARATVCDPLVKEDTSYCRDRLGLLALTSPIYIGP